MLVDKRPNSLRRLSSSHSGRRAAAVVEAAICIPVIIILMFGTLEISAGFFLQESLEIAAYEGARTGVKRRATREQAIQRVQDILAARNVELGDSGSITIEPADFSTLEALDPITVTVTAPSTGNSALIFDHVVGRMVTGSVRMAREFDE